AGFQWATQFAYDPMATAYANTEYQTHYLNLAYTPSKAISFMIASKAFHQLPRNKSYATYPADSVFDVFRISYKESLSEMNSPLEFYYSNTTFSRPVSINNLQHIAGVGSSEIVKYQGYGAYFIDKIAEGVWRLEVMPDAIHIRDPFEKASPRKEVTRIQWQNQTMQIMLPDLGPDFTVTGLNEGNDYSTTCATNTFKVLPGTYLLKSKAKTSYSAKTIGSIGTIGLKEFVAPKPFSSDVFVTHHPYDEVSSAALFTIAATIAGVNENDKVSAEIRNSSGKWKTIQFKASDAYNFSAEVPADMVTPGVINYRIIVQKQNNDFVVFPGNHKGDPYAWDEYENETWETFVASPNSPMVLFNPNKDRTGLDMYNPSWRDNSIGYITANKPGQLILKATMKKMVKGQSFGWQQYIAGKLHERQSEIASMDKMIVRARTSDAEPVKMKIVVLTKDGVAFATSITVTNQFQNKEIPLNSFKPDSTLLLPRPYPGFQPLKFYSTATPGFNLSNIDKLQVLFEEDKSSTAALKSFELESIFLDKSN
ncbi:MAG: rane or secreted protein, partial [Segetibacter sp.]|nr:rane or secreted protein [Segetibacter sp.]